MHGYGTDKGREGVQNPENLEDVICTCPLMSVSQPWLALRWRWERQLLPARPLLSAQLIAALPPLSLLSSLSKCTWSQSIASHPGNNSQRRRCSVFFVLSELEGPPWACTPLIILMDVDVKQQFWFWTQPACTVQNQNTPNIYDDKQCIYAPKNTIPCLSRLRAERLDEKSEIPVDPMQ